MTKILKYGLMLAPLLIILSLSKCTPITPVHQNNVCEIFRQYPDWYIAAKKSEQKWHVPVAVQMAIVYQESRFKATAKPPRHLLLGIIPGDHITSATGYAQAVDATWFRYQRATNHYYSNREIFANAVDFIGWYSTRAHHMLGIRRNDARDLYLAYHEGINGYANRSYRNKRWLLKIASHAQYLASTYQQQLNNCQKQLPKLHWWN